MTTTFDISTQQLRRTFKERLSDLHKTSIAGGLFNILLFLILLIPLIILFIGETIFKSITGQLNKPIDLPKQKEYLIDRQDFKIKAFDVYNDKYYDKLKEQYNKTDDDLRDIDEICFIETTPNIEAFADKLFTYTMTDFAGGIILQEVDFENWTSKILFLDLSTFKTETIKELKFTYDLTFEKKDEQELKITLKFPGDKQTLTIRKN